MDHQQGFIVGVGSRGRPVEGSCDHSFVVDHGELMVQLLAAGKARGADRRQWCCQRTVASLELAEAVGEFEAMQIEHLRKRTAGEAGVRQYADCRALLHPLLQPIAERLR